jgi:hypothetical protein
MPLAGIEPAVPSSLRPQTRPFDRTATEISYIFRLPIIELCVTPITTDLSNTVPSVNL